MTAVTMGNETHSCCHSGIPFRFFALPLIEPSYRVLNTCLSKRVTRQLSLEFVDSLQLWATLADEQKMETHRR